MNSQPHMVKIHYTCPNPEEVGLAGESLWAFPIEELPEQKMLRARIDNNPILLEIGLGEEVWCERIQETTPDGIQLDYWEIRGPAAWGKFLIGPDTYKQHYIILDGIEWTAYRKPEFAPYGEDGGHWAICSNRDIKHVVAAIWGDQEDE